MIHRARLRVIAFLCLSCVLTTGFADELRPGYLELVDAGDNLIQVVWKEPSYSGVAPELQWPGICSESAPQSTRLVSGLRIQKIQLLCEQPLAGQHFSVEGLDAANADILVRFQNSEGMWSHGRLSAGSSVFEIPTTGHASDVILTYTILGVEHILLGFDHLLFVLALLLIIGSLRQLIVTVTAFTLAHSLTLAAASLELVKLPGPPVEAIIALSIVFLAREILQKNSGEEGMASRSPWIVAFGFGLLHGFGFAGALAEIGLPQDAIVLALVFFNLGVELGQLLFVFLVAGLMAAFRALGQHNRLKAIEMSCAYGIGGMAFYWLVERVAGF